MSIVEDMTMHPWVAQQVAAAHQDDLRRAGQHRAAQRRAAAVPAVSATPTGLAHHLLARRRAQLGGWLIAAGQRIGGSSTVDPRYLGANRSPVHDR